MKTRSKKKKNETVKNTTEESGYISMSSEFKTNEAEYYSFNPFPSAEPATEIKVENYTDRDIGLVANIVESELVEFRNNNYSDDPTTVMLEKVPKTEVEIFGNDGSPSFSNEQDYLYNLENSDTERDPFEDIDLDPSFSQKTVQSPNDANDWDTQENEDDVIISSGEVNGSSNTAEIDDLEPRKSTSYLQCELCLEIQSSAAQLKTHLGICSLSHKNRLRFCVPCNKLLYSREKYIYHALHRHGVQEPKLKRYPLNCQFCHHTFVLKESLDAHVTLCHNQNENSTSSKTDNDGSTKNGKRFKCTECPSSFKHCCDYIRHMQGHKNERAFKCPMPNCERSFNFSSNLKEHLKRLHSDEKPHKCPEPKCGISFKGTAELKKHMVRHSDARPFTCSYESGCKKTFKTKDRLTQHVVAVHKGIRRVKHVIQQKQKDL